MSTIEALSEPLTQVIEATPASHNQSRTVPAHPIEIELSSNRRLEVERERGADRIRVVAPSGQIELQIVVTPGGPKLVVDAIDLEMKSAGKIRMDCDSFELNANESIYQRSEGTIEQSAASDVKIETSGDLVSKARETKLQATRGNVELIANDDVRLQGEMVKLNC